MTDARIERVYEDRIGARSFLAQAETFLGDSDASGSGAGKFAENELSLAPVR